MRSFSAYVFVQESFPVQMEISSSSWLRVYVGGVFIAAFCTEWGTRAVWIPLETKILDRRKKV